MSFQKNTAGKWRVFAFFPGTGAPVLNDAPNISAMISQDFGVRVALADVAPIEEGDGFYIFDLTAAERNADNLHIFPVTTTGGVLLVGSPGSMSAIQEVGLSSTISGSTIVEDAAADGSVTYSLVVRSGSGVVIAADAAPTWTISLVSTGAPIAGNQVAITNPSLGNYSAEYSYTTTVPARPDGWHIRVTWLQGGSLQQRDIFTSFSTSNVPTVDEIVTGISDDSQFEDLFSNASTAVQNTSIINGKLPANTSSQIALISAMRGTDNAAEPGDAMALTPLAQQALAGAVDMAFVDGGDGTDAINSIVAAIGNTNMSEATVAVLVAQAILVTPANKIVTNAGGAVVTDAASRSASQATGFATPANVSAVEAKVDAIAPSGNRRAAGEGLIATNLDQVSGGGGAGMPEDGPYDPRPVGSAFTRCPETVAGSAAGYCENSIELLVGGDGLISIDFSLLSATKLSKVLDVQIDSKDRDGVSLSTWSIAAFNTLPGGVWDYLAKVNLSGFAAGDTATVTVRVQTQDIRVRSARVNVSVS